MSLSKGVSATGSENDQKNVEGAPASGVVFKLTHIVPTTGHTAADLNPQCATGASQTCAIVSGSPSDPNPVYGVTGPDGTITAWYKTEADANNPASATPVTLPKEHRHYLLQEVTKLDGYNKSEDSVFDLPFRTWEYATTPDDNGHYGKLDGYVYHLSVFPKNVADESHNLAKKLVSVKDSNGATITGQPFVQAGDVLTYDISQRIYAKDDDANHASNDKLSLDEIYDTTSQDKVSLKIVDRLSSAFIPVDPNNNYQSVVGNSDYDNSEHKNTDITKASRIYLTYNNKDGRQTIDHSDPTYGYALSTKSTSHGPDDPGRIPTNGNDGHFPNAQPSDYMFGRGISDWPTAPGDEGQYANGNGTHYMTWSFFNYSWRTEIQQLNQKLKNENASDIVLHIVLTVKLTNMGDSVGNVDGRLTNDVASNVFGSETVDRTSAHTPSAGFEFAKTASDSQTPVEGAVFRLTKKGDSDQFLGTDGQFHTDNWYKSTMENPSKVLALTATSNNRGTIAFTNLPIMNSTRDGWNKPDGQPLEFDVMEYQTPGNFRDCRTAGKCPAYARPTMPFGHISFSNLMRNDFATYRNSLTADTRVLPDGWGTVNSSNAGTIDKSGRMPLTFGQWSVDATTYRAHPIHAMTVDGTQGEEIFPAMKNFTVDETKPMQLPLTGGIGIAILVIVGTVAVTLVLIERHHRLNETHQ